MEPSVSHTLHECHTAVPLGYTLSLIGFETALLRRSSHAVSLTGHSAMALQIVTAGCWFPMLLALVTQEAD
jgi:hypothetical protein